MGNIYRTLCEKEYEAIRERIVYEDNHLLIFNKQSGEIVQGDKSGDEPLSEKLKAFIAQRDNKPGNVFLGVVHRIDRPVSGGVIFAKTSKGLSKMNEALRVGDIHKTYRALVCNMPPKESDELCNLLWRNEKNNKSYITLQDKKGDKYKEARLKYKLLGATKNYYLLEIELFTGRHHQIRAQLAHIGCPIKGDLKYGAPRSNRDGSISLHSYKIEFMYPVKKVQISVEIPNPQIDTNLLG